MGEVIVNQREQRLSNKKLIIFFIGSNLLQNIKKLVRTTLNLRNIKRKKNVMIMPKLFCSCQNSHWLSDFYVILTVVLNTNKSMYNSITFCLAQPSYEKFWHSGAVSRVIEKIG